MKRVLLALLVLCITSAGWAMFIPGVTATSNHPSYNQDYTVENIINNSFFTPPNLHQANSYGGGMYLSQGYYMFTNPGQFGNDLPHYWDGEQWTVFDLYVEFDLGGTYDVNEMHIWNGGQTAAQERGFRKIDIAVSDDGGVTYTTVYSELILNSVFDLNPGLVDFENFPTSDIIDLGNVTADHVRIIAYPDYEGGSFRVDTTPANPWDGQTIYQLSEVKFDADIEIEDFVPTQAALTRNQVEVAASSELSPGVAQTVINHLGISDPRLFEHENNGYGGGMWVSASGGGGYLNPAHFNLPASRQTGRAWLKFDFDTAYNLGIMSIWNGKQDPHLNRGLRKVYIDYSEDGTNWNTLMNGAEEFFTLPMSIAEPTGPDIHIDFGGASAQQVVITALENDGNWGDAGYWSLSEVRFGLDGVAWPGEPNLPAEDIIRSDNITVSVPADSEAISGEEDWLVNNFGLGDNFRHIADTYGVAMLMCDPLAPSAAVPSKTTVGECWFRFDFDQVYNLGMMRVWNYNQIAGFDYTGRGVKNVTVQYTSDGVNWSTLGSFEIPMALAETEMSPNIGIDFGGIAASSVVITAADNWDEDVWFGLSQVEFGISGTTFGYEGSDAGSFLSQWLEIGNGAINCPGWDLDGDCNVTMNDYKIFAERWILSN